MREQPVGQMAPFELTSMTCASAAIGKSMTAPKSSEAAAKEPGMLFLFMLDIMPDSNLNVKF